MKSCDPFDKLLGAWQPDNPHSGAKFVQDTLRLIRQQQAEPSWKVAIASWCEVLDGWLEEWLPSPRILVPVAASLILMLSILAWDLANRRAEAFAAMQWREELSRPLSGMSLAGTYAQLTHDLKTIRNE